jgi:biotin-dependent carboxylase-like uncharacterized protein
MIEVLSSGLYTSIQDMGRFGHRRYGVPVSGAMDSYSAKLANKLLGNSDDAAVLEITLTGPVLKFTTPTQITITGAGFSPTVNDVEILLNSRIEIAAGSILKFGLPGYGLRGYLAVSGGFKPEKVLDSFSFYEGITEKGKINKGDILTIDTSGKRFSATASAKVKIDKSHFTTSEIEVCKGPEFDMLADNIKEKMLSSQLKIKAESNRMAYMLEGWENFTAKEIITGPVMPGTVQLTPSGQCVVLMRDAQTTGGYARVLQLPENSINELSQKKAGEKINFKCLKGK